MGKPQRIVSLVPSITELIWELGARDRLAGRTQFCVAPDDMAFFVREVGGTKTPDIRAIVGLHPDLVIANKEENRKQDIEALRGHGIRVVVTDPSTVDSALDMILQVGTLIGAEREALAMHAEIRGAIQQRPPEAEQRVFVPIWHRPLMAMGGDCYGSDVLALAGGRNVFADVARYPEVSLEDIAARKPDRILLPDEPFHFTGRHVAQFSAIAPVSLVSGQLLWWYGPRMGKSIVELRRVLGQGTAL